MTKQSKCTECGRLRLMYEQAVSERERFILRYQVAKILGDRTAMASVEPMVDLASEDRDRAHRAMVRHENTKDAHDRAA